MIKVAAPPCTYSQPIQYEIPLSTYKYDVYCTLSQTIQTQLLNMKKV
jgi:hypothetical protein